VRPGQRDADRVLGRRARRQPSTQHVRQLGSAVGIAILVALLASPHPSALGLFHRGWLFQIAASVSAAVAVLMVTRVPAPRHSSSAAESAIESMSLT
jgi:hypothetical protein